MAIKLQLHLDDSHSTQQSDICEPLICVAQERKPPKKVKRVSFKDDDGSNNGGSIKVVLLSTFVVVFASLEFGFCVGYSSPAQSEMMKELGLTLSQFSTFGSLLTIGATLGGFTSGQIADYLGRKGALRLCAALYIIGWFITVFSMKATFLYCARLFVGFGVGVTSFTVPVYISEITPKNLRGRLAATNQLSITSGALVVYLLGMLVGWRLLAILAIIPCILLLTGLYFIPESPRWLAKIGKDKEFETALKLLHGKGFNISFEAAEIRSYIKELEALPTAQIRDLFQSKYAHSVTVGVGLMIFQQLGGINAIIFYASNIFESAGFASGQVASVAVAALQVPMTAIGASLMDRLGRRPLLMVSAGGMSIGCCLVGLSFYLKIHATQEILLAFVAPLNLCGLLVYIATYSLGMGGIPWVIMSEIFPIHMKAIAGSLVTLVSWLGSWVITLSFNFLLDWSASGAFMVFAAASACTVLFVAKVVPETKGLTLEEIQAAFKSFVPKIDTLENA